MGRGRNGRGRTERGGDGQEVGTAINRSILKALHSREPNGLTVFFGGKEEGVGNGGLSCDCG